MLFRSNASRVQPGTLRTAVNPPCAAVCGLGGTPKGGSTVTLLCSQMWLHASHASEARAASIHNPRLSRPGRGALLWRRQRQEGRKPHAAALICNALSTATPSTQQCARRSRQQAWRRAVGGGAGRGGAAAQSVVNGSQSQRARWRQGARAMRAISLGGAGFRPSPALSSFSGASSVLVQTFSSC